MRKCILTIMLVVLLVLSLTVSVFAHSMVTNESKTGIGEEEYVTVKNYNGSWLISNIERVDVIGEITRLTIDEDEKLKSFFVENIYGVVSNYNKASVIIGKDTKIYEGYTDNELSISDLKEGTNVSVTFTDDPRIMIYPASAKARTIRIIAGDVLPESIDLKYENLKLENIAESKDISALAKLDDRKFKNTDGDDTILSLYSDSYNKVTGVFKCGATQRILPDLGYSHDLESIKLYDLQVDYKSAENEICLLFAVGSDISGYKYVFYDKNNDEWLYYHNWGTPKVYDVNDDGTNEVLMQFAGLHNNAADTNILAFDNGQLMVSKINSTFYEKTGFTKGVTTVSSEFRQQDNNVIVDIELYGEKPLCTSYSFGSSLESLIEVDFIVYDNTQYDFSFMLPDSWGNFLVVTDEWEGLSIGGTTEEKIVETGTVIRIRHPLWTSENPRQDIPIMIFTIDQWNRLNKGEFHIGAAPVGPKELERNSQFVFALPARYNYAFLSGHEEVEWILNSIFPR